MKDVIVSHKTKLYIYYYPYAEKVKPILHPWILQNSETWDKGARKTFGSNLFDHYSPPKEMNLITDYVSNLLCNLPKDYYTPVNSVPQHRNFVLRDLWGQYYSKGDFQETHNHVPYHWSWVYYVNVPKGSSPMIFDDPSGKKVYPKEGMVALFPSYLWHFVPPNKCEERSMIVGNFYCKLDDVLED
jgi:hypothetical protein